MQTLANIRKANSKRESNGKPGENRAPDLDTPVTTNSVVPISMDGEAEKSREQGGIIDGKHILNKGDSSRAVTGEDEAQDDPSAADVSLTKETVENLATVDKTAEDSGGTQNEEASVVHKQIKHIQVPLKKPLGDVSDSSQSDNNGVHAKGSCKAGVSRNGTRGLRITASGLGKMAFEFVAEKVSLPYITYNLYGIPLFFYFLFP